MSGLLICLLFSFVWLSADQFAASVPLTSKKSNYEFIADADSRWLFQDPPL